MALLKRLINHFQTPGSGLGLGLFRIVFGLVLQFEILQLFFFHDLFYAKIPGDSWNLDGNFKFLFLIWSAVIWLITAGIGLRFATIANYALSVTFFGTFDRFEYHADYFYLGANFLLMFLPAHTAFSLRLPGRWRQIPPQAPESVTWGFVTLFGALGAGFVYLDSIFTKLDSKMWLAGLGFFTPASLPMGSWGILDPLLAHEYLIKGMGFSVLLFEFLFLFLLPFQRFRPWLAVFGFCFHAGISLAFPIPCFGLALSTFFLMLFPDHLWRKCFALFRMEATPGSLNLERANRLLPWGIGFAALATGIQVILSLMHPILQRHLPGAVNRMSGTARNLILPWSRQFLGMTRHGVFMDGHFADYNHEISVAYVKNGKERWLPLINQDGHPGYYVHGRLWVYYSFRVCSAKLRMPALENGLRRLTWFWCKQNKISLADAQFVVKVRKMTVPFSWQKDIVELQRKASWTEVGTIHWTNSQCEIQLPDIETL